MIQITKKAPHSPIDVLAFRKKKKKHTISIRTKGKGKAAEFFAKLNKKELKEICLYIEANFSIHKEDL